MLNLFENGMFPVLMTEDEILVEEDPDKEIFDKLTDILNLSGTIALFAIGQEKWILNTL